MKRVIERFTSQLPPVLPIERFVMGIFGGGIGLVAGLWITELTTAISAAWLVGVGVAAVSGIALIWGLWSQINY